MKLAIDLLYTTGVLLLLLGGCGMDSDLSVIWLPILWMVAGGLLIWGAHSMEAVHGVDC